VLRCEQRAGSRRARGAPPTAAAAPRRRHFSTFLNERTKMSKNRRKCRHRRGCHELRDMKCKYGIQNVGGRSRTFYTPHLHMGSPARPCKQRAIENPVYVGLHGEMQVKHRYSHSETTNKPTPTTKRTMRKRCGRLSRLSKRPGRPGPPRPPCPRGGRLYEGCAVTKPHPFSFVWRTPIEPGNNSAEWQAALGGRRRGSG
jgi:hypothetical protein